MKNVVLILADQLRKDHLGCYGNKNVSTPNIDFIAERGVVFENCFVSSPLCMPSRASIFTGQYVHNHQLWANGVMQERVPPNMGDYLRRAGYATASIGKMHLSPYGAFGDTPEISPEDQRRWRRPGAESWHGPYWGFEYVELTVNHSTRPAAHFGEWFYENGGRDEMISESAFGRRIPKTGTEVRTTNIPESLHDSTFVGVRSGEFIRKAASEGRPFFLTASFPDPHHPYNPPEETMERYKNTPVTPPTAEDDGLEGRPRHYKQHQRGVWHPAGAQRETPEMTEEERQELRFHRELLEKYKNPQSQMVVVGTNPEPVTPAERDARIRSTYAMIDLIDKGVGRILAVLRETGELENTVIIFAADHGDLMGDHGLWKKGPFFFDGLVNTPLIISDPYGERGVRTGLASLVDIFPTVAQLLGLQRPPFCDGVSLVPAMSGGTARTQCLIEYRNGYLENELHANAYIDERYKFVQYSNGERELTDRINDREERVNLAAGPENAGLVSLYQEKLLLMLLNAPAKYPQLISTF